MNKNILTIEKMPTKKRVPFYMWASEIVCWLIIIYAVIYFAPTVIKIFMR